MFKVISGLDSTTWYESTRYEDCEEYIHNHQDVASEQELFIEEF
jgi:hypothetical protein